MILVIAFGCREYGLTALGCNSAQRSTCFCIGNHHWTDADCKALMQMGVCQNAMHYCSIKESVTNLAINVNRKTWNIYSGMNRSIPPSNGKTSSAWGKQVTTISNYRYNVRKCFSSPFRVPWPGNVAIRRAAQSSCDQARSPAPTARPQAITWTLICITNK